MGGTSHWTVLYVDSYGGVLGAIPESDFRVAAIRNLAGAILGTSLVTLGIQRADHFPTDYFQFRDGQFCVTQLSWSFRSAICWLHVERLLGSWWQVPFDGSGNPIWMDMLILIQAARVPVGRINFEKLH